MEKILQIDVDNDLLINNIKTSLLLLNVAKEAGYNKVTINLVGLDPNASPYKEPIIIDQVISEQKEYLEYILKDKDIN